MDERFLTRSKMMSPAGFPVVSQAASDHGSGDAGGGLDGGGFMVPKMRRCAFRHSQRSICFLL